MKEFHIARAKEVTGYEGGVPFKMPVTELVWDDLSIAADKYLRTDVAEAFRLMYEAAQVSGLMLRVNSAWRSKQHQDRLYRQWKMWFDRWSLIKGDRPKRRPRPARPGYSNHHNGVAVDINRSHDDPDGDGHSITDAWLESNAHKFGFTMPYGIEKWHWEYHGV